MTDHPVLPPTAPTALRVGDNWFVKFKGEGQMSLILAVEYIGAIFCRPDGNGNVVIATRTAFGAIEANHTFDDVESTLVVLGFWIGQSGAVKPTLWRRFKRWLLH